MSVRNKTIVVCISGGIAAYKSILLVRELVKAGADVHVAMTKAATEFIGPLTLHTLTGHPVFTNMFDLTQESDIGHIKLADKADLVIVAPATATTLSRLAHGEASDPVSCVCLATTAPILVAPAMNVNMWRNPITQDNLRRLERLRGVTYVGPDSGFLACQWQGKGRMAAPEAIALAAARLLTPPSLRHKHVVVSAGPTREAIDPVRFLSNRSTGRMGVALANAAWRLGARVTLLLGPGADHGDLSHLRVVPFTSAADLHAAMMREGATADIICMAAAVADYRPDESVAQKVKKSQQGDKWTLSLSGTRDVLAELTALTPKPYLVGFAAETENVLENAKAKIARKGCDAIVVNDVSRADAGFEVATNEVTIVRADGASVFVPLACKDEVAQKIADTIAAWLEAPGA